MLIAAITGNFGMGKSSVLACFKRLGAVTISSDEVVSGFLGQKRVVNKVSRALGRRVLTREGELDRGVIAGLVFRDEKLRRKLESILHPLVFLEVEKKIRSVRPPEAVVVVEVPLLFEGNYQTRFARTVTVHTNRKTVLSRLRNSGISRSEAIRRWKAQLPIRMKKKLSDFTIDNNGTPRETCAQVRRIYRQFLRESIQPVRKDRRRS